MRYLEYAKMALRTIVSNPLRTILTMLGVIIGVSSVITLVSIGRGTTASIAKQFDSLGTNLLVVTVNGKGRATELDYQSLMQMEQFPEFKWIAPVMLRPNSNIAVDRKQDAFTLIGTNSRYLPITNAKVAEGRFLTEPDMEFRSQVAVLGSDVATEFFGFMNPVGEILNIDGKKFTVIGVLAPKGSNIDGNSVDDTVIVPLETARRVYKLGEIKTTYFEASSKDAVATAQSTLENYLAYTFKSTDGFKIYNQDELLNTRKQATDTVTKQLVSVALISLLVGGIGIMNIMMVTVSERTREIGVRKAIGAKRRSILLQFLVEALVISGLGGLVGFVLGVILSVCWPYFYPQQVTQISWDTGLYAFLFSAGVGVLFGMYPAFQASRLQPVDALRYE